MKLTKLIKSVIVLSSLFVCVAEAAQNSPVIPYYGEEFYAALKAGDTDDTLVYKIKAVLRSYHVKQNGKPDLIVKSCLDQKGNPCYAHTPISYGEARKFLMGKFYLHSDGAGGYTVKDVYCNVERPARDFRKQAPKPGTIPDNKVINVEHTWPQSRFARKFSDDLQKSDLHHLFPTDSQLNAIRGNNLFGEVTTDLIDLKCPASRFGVGSAGQEDVFEPPQQHKGNVARALFYFSVRYDLFITGDEEKILRKWHVEDPVDDEEMRRNNEIFKVQSNRNPFIDFPEIVDSISNF